MTGINFILFDVDHGQCAGLRLPNDSWCLFDAGGTASFSPISYMSSVTPSRKVPAPLLRQVGRRFRLYKATISHLHGDHLTDLEMLKASNPRFVKTVAPDAAYIVDSIRTTSEESRPKVMGFVGWRRKYPQNSPLQPDFQGVRILEHSLPVKTARLLGGDASHRVNNASVVTRIEYCGFTILICGDMMKEGWDHVFKKKLILNYWPRFVSRVDILVAPHHGHSSGYSQELMDLARPALVLASMASGDQHVDSRYSAIDGVTINEERYKLITTRKYGSVIISVTPKPIPTAHPAITVDFRDLK